MNTARTSTPMNESFPDLGRAVNYSPKKTIVLYSPDMDFCVSLQLLFEDQYHVVTTTDPDMILLLAKAFQPELIIADALPTHHMRRRFEIVKSQYPTMSIMMFSVTLPQSQPGLETFRNIVDAVYSKPIDLFEVMKRIDELVMSDVCKQ